MKPANQWYGNTAATHLQLLLSGEVGEHLVYQDLAQRFQQVPGVPYAASQSSLCQDPSQRLTQPIADAWMAAEDHIAVSQHQRGGCAVAGQLPALRIMT